MSGATKILMGSGGVDLPSDDEFDNVSFLSHFDGSNNGTNIAYDDSSASNHTVSLTGTPQQGTFSPFSRVDGEWSNWFDGTNDVFYLDASSGSDFNFGTGAFTIEGWFYNEGTTANWAYPLAAGNMLQFYVYLNARILFNMTYSEGGASAFSLEGTPGGSSGSLPLNQWHHWAVTKEGSNASVLLNGTRNATSSSVSGTFSAPTGNMFVGGFDSGASYGLGGYMSNVRIVKGTAVYDPTSSSCTVPTSALTAVSGTVLLTCQSNRFKDNSSSAHALTTQGVPEVKAFTPFLTSKVYDPAVNGASAFFLGHGTATELLVDATGSDFTYGTGAFTIEGWYYWSSGASSYYPFIYAMGNMIQFYRNGANTLWYLKLDEDAGSWEMSATVAAGTVENQWNHFAVTRSGSDLSVFINGVRVATESSVSGSFDGASGGGDSDDMYLGGHMHNSTHYPFGGYLSDYRILKGTALYDPTSSTCTVPTAPLTAITNTKLLLNMADGQALDSFAQNNMLLVGNADTSTSQQKFGTASLALDETGDYVTLPHGNFESFGTGNFTIECFVRFAASTVGNGQGLFQLSNGYLNTTTRGPAAGGDNATGRWSIYYGTSILTHGSIVPSTDTWYHVAYVRNSGTTKLYVDGTEILSVSDSTDYTDTYFTIGGWYTTDYLLNGYIDEFRISHVARYTSDFTPTTEAFPDKGQ